MADGQVQCGEWWREYFGKYYLLVEGVKSREATLRSADFIEQVFDLPRGQPDLRHRL